MNSRPLTATLSARASQYCSKSSLMEACSSLGKAWLCGFRCCQPLRHRAVQSRAPGGECACVFANVTALFVPFLWGAGHVAPGMRVLDIATGTGLSAEAALAAVGPTGHVTAADVSPAMAEKARERLGKARNVSVSVEDGQALSFADSSFDVLLCNLGLIFFPDPVRGLSEFRRVLRPGGCLAGPANP